MVISFHRPNRLVVPTDWRWSSQLQHQLARHWRCALADSEAHLWALQTKSRVKQRLNLQRAAGGGGGGGCFVQPTETVAVVANELAWIWFGKPASNLSGHQAAIDHAPLPEFDSGSNWRRDLDLDLDL